MISPGLNLQLLAKKAAGQLKLKDLDQVMPDSLVKAKQPNPKVCRMHDNIQNNILRSVTAEKEASLKANHYERREQ